jgi:1-acyl-sn-glycerol-3-phosphate acyltransferase
MREAGFVAIDRSGNRAQVAHAMRLAKAAIDEGTSVWIAPEGTRSPDGRLGKFKKGGFVLALAAGAPIVPMCIDGSRLIIPKKTRRVRRGQRVQVTFGAPIAVAGRTVESLTDELRGFIAAHLTPSSDT